MSQLGLESSPLHSPVVAALVQRVRFLADSQYVLEGLLVGGGLQLGRGQDDGSSGCPTDACYVAGSAIPIPLGGLQRPPCCISVQV